MSIEMVKRLEPFREKGFRGFGKGDHGLEPFEMDCPIPLPQFADRWREIDENLKLNASGR